MAVLPRPSGFIFYPTDEEILDTFLKKKLQRLPLPNDRIKEADVYGTHPSNLTAQFEKTNRLLEWFFFTWTTRKHPDATNSTRASRVAGQGRWKSTQSVKLVRNGKGRVVGSKQNFCYMEHTAQGKEKKTIWLMEEYSIQSLRTGGGVAMSKDQKKLDDWVVCKIYLRPCARKEPYGMKVAAMEMRNLERLDIGNQPFITQVQDSLNSQLADDMLPPLIDASDQEMVPFRFPYSVLQHPAPQDMDGSFGSLYHEQPAGAPNEGLDYAPQHDVAGLLQIHHPFYHEQPVGASNGGLDYGPQLDVVSLPEIPHIFYHERSAGASNEGLDFDPQHDVVSLHQIPHPFYHEQPASAPNEGLDYAPQHDMMSLPENLHPFDHEHFVGAPDEGHDYAPQYDIMGLPELLHPFDNEHLVGAPDEGLNDYAPQHDIMSLPEILHPFDHKQLAGAPDEGLDYVPAGIEQLDLASLPPLDLSFSSIDEILKQFAPDEAPSEH
ncbi:putative NAC domain-containing protein 68 [Cocos nucifera]|uniref:Putative NAC domain-containing protein 68 n=1 Tax=Cocos nucifera TaxID=13894 RepID=A0A8K0I620_COCNU|nr:putative NAC domain-containing protein 68 [Cocos nucifera]